MEEHVYKIIELVGSSRSGVEDAVRNAVQRAAKTVRNVRWFKVSDVRGFVDGDRVDYWQVSVKIGFNIEGAGGAEKKESSGKNEEPSAKSKGGAKSAKYRCTVCGYVYDPEKGDPGNGIKPGTPFKDLPDDWRCPECGVKKDKFEKM